MNIGVVTYSDWQKTHLVIMRTVLEHNFALCYEAKLPDNVSFLSLYIWSAQGMGTT
jgi:hypothetical protein